MTLIVGIITEEKGYLACDDITTTLHNYIKNKEKRIKKCVLDGIDSFIGFSGDVKRIQKIRRKIDSDRLLSIEDIGNYHAKGCLFRERKSYVTELILNECQELIQIWNDGSSITTSNTFMSIGSGGWVADYILEYINLHDPLYNQHEANIKEILRDIYKIANNNMNSVGSIPFIKTINF